MKAVEFSLNKTTFIIQGIYSERGENVLFVDGVQLTNLAESLFMRKHSLDGPNWGYRGSGPAQAALMVCLHIFQNEHLAQELYQSFKEVFVAHWGENGKSFTVQIDLTEFLINNRESLLTAAIQASFEEQQVGFALLEQAQQLLNPVSAPVFRQPGENASQSKFTVGDVVEMQIGLLNIPSGSRAVVYECYEPVGISLISEGGEVLGGFCVEEQTRFVKWLYRAPNFTYKFKSISYLIDDWRNGRFIGVFNNPLTD